MQLFVSSIFAFILMVFLQRAVLYALLLKAASNIHNSMVFNILRSQMTFYDSNPIGRINTRFTKDMTSVDAAIPFLIMMVGRGAARTISVVISVAVVNPAIILVAALGLAYCVYVYKAGMQPTINCIRFN